MVARPLPLLFLALVTATLPRPASGEFQCTYSSSAGLLISYVFSNCSDDANRLNNAVGGNMYTSFRCIRQYNVYNLATHDCADDARRLTATVGIAFHCSGSSVLLEDCAANLWRLNEVASSRYQPPTSPSYNPQPPSGGYGYRRTGSRTSEDTFLTGASLMGLVLGIVLLYCFLHAAVWFLPVCPTRDMSNGFQPSGMDLLCPSFMVAAQDGCSPGCVMAGLGGNCCFGPCTALPFGAIYTACCWKPQTPWTHRDFPKPVVAAVVFTFFLVWILATAGTSDPSMLTLEGEAVVGMFSIGMDGISDLDNCAIWGTSDEGIALGHACKAAKAFGIIGLLTNVVAIMAVLANFKVIPFFHASARMASIVALLTTGVCYLTVVSMWLGIFLHFRIYYQYVDYSLGAAFALYCTSLVLLFIGFWVVWASKDPSGANDATIAELDAIAADGADGADAAAANPSPDATVNAQPLASGANPAFSPNGVNRAPPVYTPEMAMAHHAKHQKEQAVEVAAPAADANPFPEAADANPFPEAADANPFPEAAPAARQSPLPAIAVELGLDQVDLAAYKHLWESAETVNDRLPAVAALTFFVRSGLDAKKPGTLRAMWGLADTESPKGSLNQHEFFRACKLVAQAQVGEPMSVSTFAEVDQLPFIEGIVQSGSNSEA